MLWNKATPAEQRIKEIEQGIKHHHRSSCCSYDVIRFIRLGIRIVYETISPLTA